MFKKRFPFVLGLCLMILFSCNSENREEKKKKNTKQKKEIVKRDLEDIKTDGVLKVLTTYSSTSYFLYKGHTMGYEYDLLKRFAKHLDLELDITISNNIDSLLNELNDGDVDMVAHGLTITNERKQDVDFTDYLYLTHQVLVQKKPDNWRKLKWSALESSLIHDAIELIGDTVSVRQNSSYMERLKNLSDEFGGTIYIDTLSGDLSTDEIIEMVVNGDIKYTIADNNLASINASYYPILNVEVPISFSQRLAWAVRTSSPQLKLAVNDWLKMMKKETEYYVIYNKYFKNTKAFDRREESDYFTLNSNKISKYDDLIKKYAKAINWDWKLLASLIFQESHFDPGSNSWAGAHGLMQIMPETAEGLGVKDRSHPEESLKGGTKYLDMLWKRFDEVEDSIQRIKFTMASYNCGYSHVVDGQRLAKEENLDENMWDNNVAEMILKLSYRENYTKPFIKFGYVRGREPYNYVNQIFNRYEQYKQFVN